MVKEKKHMTLEEFMHKVDANETVFIGAASGYLFIGNVDAYEADFSQIEKEIEKKLQSTEKRVNALIEETNKLIQLENECRDGHDFESIKDKCLCIEKGLRHRRVLETYKKTLEGSEAGTAVIIRGTEHGKYWFKSEYDKERRAKA